MRVLLSPLLLLVAALLAAAGSGAAGSGAHADAAAPGDKPVPAEPAPSDSPTAASQPEWLLPEEEPEPPLPTPEPPGAKAILIGGERIAQGQKKEVTLRLSESFAGANVDIPVVVVRGRRPGPSLCLVGGVHGDELNGMEIVRLAMEAQTPEGLSGTVIGVPIVNMFGFVTQARYLPDRRDLNRHFPGSPTGSTAARIAYRFFTEVVRHCTHLVDLHTGSLQRTNVAQIRGDLRDPRVLLMARAFGAPAIVHKPGSKGTLRRTAARLGVAAILYEAGETLRFQQPEIRRGVAGIKSVLAALGMREGVALPGDDSTVYGGSVWVRAERGGLLDLLVRPGDAVEKGDLLGTISDPVRREKGYVRAPRSGRVLGAVVAPMVLPGLAVVDLGIEGPPPQKRERKQPSQDTAAVTETDSAVALPAAETSSVQGTP